MHPPLTLAISTVIHPSRTAAHWLLTANITSSPPADFNAHYQGKKGSNPNDNIRGCRMKPMQKCQKLLEAGSKSPFISMLKCPTLQQK